MPDGAWLSRVVSAVAGASDRSRLEHEPLTTLKEVIQSCVSVIEASVTFSIHGRAFSGRVGLAELIYCTLHCVRLCNSVTHLNERRISLAD